MSQYMRCMTLWKISDIWSDYTQRRQIYCWSANQRSRILFGKTFIRSDFIIDEWTTDIYHLNTLMSTVFVWLILFAASLCLAMLQCQPPPAMANLPYPPFPSDCRQALAHMPLIDEDFGDRSFNPIRLLDPSSPFLPQTQFRHASCVISIGYIEDFGSDDISDVLRSHPTNSEPDVHNTAVHEESVFHIWGMLRLAGKRIVEECVDHNRIGVEWNPLNMPTLPNAWYVVTVRGPEELDTGGRSLRGKQRTALRLGGTGQRIPLDVADKFKTSFFDVEETSL